MRKPRKEAIRSRTSVLPWWLKLLTWSSTPLVLGLPILLVVTGEADACRIRAFALRYEGLNTLHPVVITTSTLCTLIGVSACTVLHGWRLALRASAACCLVVILTTGMALVTPYRDFAFGHFLTTLLAAGALAGFLRCRREWEALWPGFFFEA